jgi:hypothetical protein
MAKLVKLDSLRVDLKAQSDGQWQPAPWPGVRFRVRSIEFEAYTNERDRERERLAAQYLSGANIPNGVWSGVLGRLLAEHILLEWDGISPAYDTDVAYDVLTAADGTAMRDAIVKAAQRVGVRELEFVAEVEKNSAGASAIN